MLRFPKSWPRGGGKRRRRGKSLRPRRRVKSRKPRRKGKSWRLRLLRPLRRRGRTRRRRWTALRRRRQTTANQHRRACQLKMSPAMRQKLPLSRQHRSLMKPLCSLPLPRCVEIKGGSSLYRPWLKWDSPPRPRRQTNSRQGWTWRWKHRPSLSRWKRVSRLMQRMLSKQLVPLRLRKHQPWMQLLNLSARKIAPPHLSLTRSSIPWQKARWPPMNRR
mmetsp:Transcript_5434/g.8549  ORF Transcript_5434/g.8549 Transcript_5434/m.8549 type:complete len:218 (+) Transcript_5434:240-893(+)